ncbi:hypothetical protein PG999_014017 [Apiospora kogelbergensis]|uniref:Uncharacterized protein n=1 Tax=Apiospora kogelbergensis TaxID=1337665 RepID=A0AAW0QH27_9PEZI
MALCRRHRQPYQLRLTVEERFRVGIVLNTSTPQQPQQASPPSAPPSAPAPTAAGLASAVAPDRDNDNKSPFHTGLQDILQGVFGHGAKGPTMPEVEKLADELRDLIQGALLDRLVKELREGLLERLLVEYLEELVTGVVVHGLDRANKKRKDKSGGDHGGAADWKKTAVKRAFKIFVERFANKSS